MTRTTLKALWFGGGGILATWLAVSPNHGMPSSSQNVPSNGSSGAAVVSAEQLNSQAERLRERAAGGPLSESRRNPFRYNAQHAPAAVRQAPPPVQMPVLNTPAALPMTLSGVAQKAGKRTAIITMEGQLYVVGEGQTFAGRYTMIKIDPETVLFRDTDGVERRLALPQ